MILKQNVGGRMKKFLLVPIVFTFLFCSCTPNQQTIPITPTSHFESTFKENKQIVPDNSLDFQLANLTNQIVESLSHESKSKIAIIEFSDLNGNVTEFGMYLSEELITRLFLTRKFDVIERQLLNQVISEQKLGMTGLIDDESAIAIGKLLGVDAIVSGTVTDLGISLKVNARLIATETGSVFAVASTEIFKDEKVKTLINRMKETKPTVIKKEETEKPEEKIILLDKRIFFKEDFSDIAEGMVPEDWLGCEHLMVRTKSRSGRKYLTPFEKGSKKISLQKINFPKNFRINIVGKFPRKYNGEKNIIVNIGNLKAKVGYYEVSLGDTKGKGEANTITDISIVKQGPLFKLYIDGGQKVLARYPNFTLPTSLIVDFSSSSVDFELYEISCINLGE